MGALPRLVVRPAVLPPWSAGTTGDFWETIEPVVLRETAGGGMPSQATWVRTARDAEEWRVLFRSADAHPWATLTERDGALWTEEVVEVFIDPVGDLASYFEIEVNPLGAVTDLVLRRTASGWRKEFGWHADGLASRVRVTTEGWEAELSIPFAALVSAAPLAGEEWRVNFLRIDRPHGAGSEAELSAWSPTGRRNFHRPECFGYVRFGAESD